MSLQRFCEISGLSKVPAWRYEKRGWLRTHLIANRRYILAADVAEFKGGSPQMNSPEIFPPHARSSRRKKHDGYCGEVGRRRRRGVVSCCLPSGGGQDKVL